MQQKPNETSRDETATYESYPRIHGRCPMGCGETLFLGKGGHVTCSYLPCPNPSRVTQLLDQFEGRERYMLIVVKESAIHRTPNIGAAPGVGMAVTSFVGTSGSPMRWMPDWASIRRWWQR